MPISTSTRPEVERQRREEADAGASGNMRFPNKPFPHSMLLVFEEYDYSNFASFKSLQTNRLQQIGGFIDGIASTGRQSGVSLRRTSSIELPFPKQLSDTSALIINGVSRNPLTEGLTKQLSDFAKTGTGTIGSIPGGIQSAGAASQRVISALLGTGSGNIGSVIQEAARTITGTSTGDAAAASMFLLRKFLPDSIGQSVNLATGNFLNPRETLAFEGVQLKQHTFSWDLYPNNAKDSVLIQQIIKKFKKSVLPVTQNLGSSATGVISEAFLRYPHICKIFLIGVDAEYYMKFKPAMVTNMTVDYAAGGTLGIMQGGRPAGVSITISLQELQIETANDYGAVSPANAAGMSEIVQTASDLPVE